MPYHLDHLRLLYLLRVHPTSHSSSDAKRHRAAARTWEIHVCAKKNEGGRGSLMVAVITTFLATLAEQFRPSVKREDPLPGYIVGPALVEILWIGSQDSSYWNSAKEMDISLGLEDTHVLVTGGAGLIGTVVVKAFIAAGAKVSSLDISYTKDQDPPASDSDNPLTLHADTTDEQSLFSAFELAYLKNGPIQVCVALAALDLSALPHHASAADMPLEQFRRTIDVNVVGTFATARQWLRGLKFWAKEHGLSPLLPNVSLIIVGSESGHWCVYVFGRSI
jgi:hypothetical protein